MRKRNRGHDATGRSMREQRHVRLYHWLLESPAWTALGAPERALYVALAQRYNGSNNGQISLAIRSAGEAIGVSKNTAHRAFQRLIDLGFVDVVTKGHFDRKMRHASEWRLTEYACNVTNEPASKRFMRWGMEKKPVPHVGQAVPVVGQEERRGSMPRP
jgi:hypothetical protein